MNRSLAFALVVLALVSGVHAQQSPAVAPSPPPAAGAPPEPNVQRTVIDEREVRIEELRVRGQLQRVIVSPKGARPYEILTGEGPRQVSDGRGASQGAAGQRVWNVLNF